MATLSTFFFTPWAQASYSCTYVPWMFQYILYTTTNIITLFHVHWFNNNSVPKCLSREEQKIKLPETKGWWKYWNWASNLVCKSTGPLLFEDITVKCSLLHLASLESGKCSNPPSMPICPLQFVLGCVHHKPLSKLHLWFYPRHKNHFVRVHSVVGNPQFLVLPTKARILCLDSL